MYKSTFQSFIKLQLLCFMLAFSSTMRAQEEDLQPYLTVLETVIEALHEGDGEPLAKAIDMAAILDKGMADLVIDADFARGFRQQALSSVPAQLGQFTVQQLAARDAVIQVIGVAQEADRVVVITRTTFAGGDGGYNFTKYYLHKVADGAIRIADWFDYATGFFYSESLSHIANTLAPNPTLVGKLYDLAVDKQYVRDQFLGIVTNYRNGKHDQVVASFLALKPELQADRLLLYFAIQSSQAIADDESYLKILEKMAQHHADEPSLQMVLLDYYFMKTDYAAVVKGLELLQQSLGVADAALHHLKANTYIAMDNQTLAIKEGRAAIEVDPGFENGYWVLLEVYLGLNNWKQAVEIASILEAEFQYDFSPEALAGQEVYAPLVESVAYQNWRAAISQ